MARRDIGTALRLPTSGLAVAGFIPARKFVFERVVSGDINWRVGVVRDQDQDPWFGEVIVGVDLPALRPVLRYQRSASSDAGVYSRNLLALADRRRSLGVAEYRGARFRRKGIFGTRSEEEVEVLVAAELGELFGRVAMPWFDRLRTVSSVATDMESWLSGMPEGKEPIEWADLGAVWHYSGDPERAERAWKRSASMGREYANYAAHLRASLMGE